MLLGYIGLGKMGLNMAERLLEKGHQVAAFDRNTDAVAAIGTKGARTAGSLADLAASLPAPRLLWLMVPHQVVDAVLDELMPLLAPGDTVIDGGNSLYTDSQRRERMLSEKGIDFLDVGTSGGPRGAREGACLMIGGKKATYERLEPLFRDLAADHAYAYLGPTGAGHFVKMVHNGIEYGMMQALAEGFAVMRASSFGLDLTKAAEVYNHRSVIESRLVGWLVSAYEQYGPDLAGVSGSAAQSGEGMWTVNAAKELGMPVPVIEAALAFRLASQKAPSYTGQVVSALRNQFGGHAVRAEGK